MMSEITKDELADILDGPRVFIASTRREAAARLRSMPEGKRIEGLAFLDGDNFCPEGDQPSWVVVPNCPHDDGQPDDEHFRATLFLQHGEERHDAHQGGGQAAVLVLSEGTVVECLNCGDRHLHSDRAEATVCPHSSCFHAGKYVTTKFDITAKEEKA